MRRGPRRENIERFADKYRLCCSPVRLDIERDALGADYGSTGYTTRAQADELGRLLALGPGVRLADIGSGSGWPGLYLAERTGCQVFGTDLPLDGVRRGTSACHRRRARRPRHVRGGDRSEPAVPPPGASTPSCTPTSCAVWDRSWRCCAPAERCCAPVAAWPSPRSSVAPGLDAAQHRRAVRAGPWQVLARRPYPELVEQAGFTDIVEVDVSEDYGRIQAAWLDATEARADEVRRLISDPEFHTAQADRRRARAAIEEGLLRRSLITADPSLKVFVRTWAVTRAHRALVADGELSLVDDRNREHRHPAAVLVSNDPYALHRPIVTGTRPSLTSGRLGILVIDRPDAATCGGREPGRAWTATSLKIDAPGPVHAGVDGESVELMPPLEFVTLPAALRVRISSRHPGVSPSGLVRRKRSRPVG